MEQLIEFVGNHPILVGSLMALVAALVFTEMQKGGRSISPQEVTELVNHQGALVLDVREKSDYSKGHIVDAVNIPWSKVAERLVELKGAKEKPVIIVDAMGQHSGTVGKQLLASGFGQVVRLRGGISSWTSDGLPLVKK